jgi:hypothetical protein
MKTIFTNIWTTLAGVVVLVCSGTELSGVLPEKYNVLLHSLCALAIAFGLIAAKDGNVSNAQKPGEATKVG